MATLVLAAIVLIVFGGLRFWETADRYHIVFDSSVYGLEPGAQVYLNGVRAGTVERVEVDRDDIRKVAVAIKLEQGTPVRTDTRAVLQYAGITGLKVIDLRGGSSAAAVLPRGAQIATGAGLLDKLEAQAQAIADQTAALMQRANHLTDNLIAVTDDLGAIARPAKRAAESVAAMTESLKSVVDDNRTAVRQTLTAVRRTANTASELIDGQAAQVVAGASAFVSGLNKLVTANEAPLRAAMFDLREATRSFKELVRDVRQKPSRLLFSSSPAERQLP
jgi:phospholipid/cholesterol/gamma-HCH transport system substrate-binding protein